MTDDRHQPSADEQLVGGTLAYQYQGVPGLLSICSDADKWVGRRFPTDEAGIAAATAYVMQLDRRHPKGIYSQVTTLREHPVKGRGGKELAHGVNWLWADGDFGNVGHKPGADELPHPIDAEHVRDIVLAASLPEPTGWVLSGGGCNPVWMLDQPHVIGDEADRAATEQITAGLQAVLGATAYGHGCAWDTQVGNLDRLMRIPGTVNRKGDQHRPTSSTVGTGLPVTLEAMREAVARLEPDARATLEKAAEEKRARHDERTGQTPIPPTRTAQPSDLPGSGASVFDILAAGLSFRDVLEPAGWTYRGTTGGRERWLRPAGAEGSADSDYSLICDDHVAVNWSERSGLPVGQQPAGRKLTVPTLWAHLHYGGNESEAARDVLRAAYAQPCAAAARALPVAVLAQVKQYCRPPRTETPAPALPAPPEDIWWPDEGTVTEDAPAGASEDASAAEERERAPRTWKAQDLTSVLDGTYKPPQPTVGRRDDGIGLFYPGRMNSVASESEAGKTWFALVACLQEINDGNHVLYIDFEDDAGGVVGRLLALGAVPADILERFHYVRPETKPSDTDIADLGEVLVHRPTLAVIDGVTEAMSLYGLELKDNTDVAKFGRQLLRPLANLGAAVVTLDHVVKSSESRGRYSLGGVHKLNGLNGVMYMLENVRPFGVGVTGKTIVRIAKDRPAQLRKNGLPHKSGMHWFADLVIKSETPEFAEAHLYAPIARAEDDLKADEETARIGALKRKALEVLGRAREPLTGKGIEDRVTGKAADVRRAVAELVDEGRVSVASGPRGAHLHTLAAETEQAIEHPAA